MDLYSDLERLSLAVEAEQEQINNLQRSHSELRDEVLALRKLITSGGKKSAEKPSVKPTFAKDAKSVDQVFLEPHRQASQRSSPVAIRSPSAESIGKALENRTLAAGDSSAPLSERLAAVVGPTVARHNIPGFRRSFGTAPVRPLHSVSLATARPELLHEQLMSESCREEENLLSLFMQVVNTWDAASVVVHAAGFLVALCLRAVSSGFRNVLDEMAFAFPLWFPQRIYVFGGSQARPGVTGPLTTAERFDTKSSTWELICPMSSARKYSSAVAAEGHIYILGGHDGQCVLDTVERYSAASNTWQVVPKMQFRRFGAVAVALRDHGIYVAGGHDKAQALTSCELLPFEPSCKAVDTRCWRSAPGLRTARVFATGAVLDGRVFVIGGTDAGDRVHSSSEWFDHIGAKWILDDFPRNITPRLGAALITRANVKSDAYLISAGGYAEEDKSLKALACVETLMVSRGVCDWNRLPDMQYKRLGAVGTVCNGSVYVLGGRDGDDVLASVEYWNEDKWQSIAEMTMPREASACVVARF